MKPLVRLRRTTLLIGTILLLGWFAMPAAPNVFGVSPPPDGGYPNFNTAEGTFSLLNLTTGSGNTALGARALQSNTTSSSNTAVGYGSLFSNRASLNTAVGFDTLFSNVTGEFNTAMGERALFHNVTGILNTAEGAVALFSNIGNYNTADGAGALFSNIGPLVGCEACGNRNTAVGAVALFSNQSGYSNTAIGTNALFVNAAASNNTAIGDGAMGMGGGNGSYNTAVGSSALGGSNSGGELGSYNTAAGFQAGFCNSVFGGPGDYNIAVGAYAGSAHIVLDSWNIDIGNNAFGGDSNTIRLGTQFDSSSGIGQNRVFIAGIAGTTLDNGVPVVVDTSTGQLGVLPSSQRFKAEIKPMDKTSEAILALRPVTFCYTNSNAGTSQFGLIAEEVAKVSPDLVARDPDGEPYGVRYDAVNAMLLNEFLKEHREVEAQQKQIEDLTARLDQQAAQIQKVSAQLELSKFAPQTVLNNQ